ncbi:MAG: winged helix-turn-helix domain-containing protein [Terracidiphilus sp.]|nr:winged helix-turn-helix domain-containing protein [Terracidiphilus sp.]
MELCRNGIPIKLREQSFLILVYLVEHAGEIVSREDLRRLLWPSDTFVDFDHSLNTAMMKLREALGDSTDTPLYIETIPKRGYRFIAPISAVTDSRNVQPRANGDPVAPQKNGMEGQRQVIPDPVEKPAVRRRIAFTTVVIGLLLLVAFWSVWAFWTHRGSGSLATGSQVSSTLAAIPVTTAPGQTLFPAFSPDEKWIAYLWNGPEQNYFDVYVQLLGSGTPNRLTDNKSASVGPPAWSPDGTEIAFSRCDGKNDGVFAVPAMGGSERKLTSLNCIEGGAGSTPVAWLHDGSGLLIADSCSAGGSPGPVPSGPVLLTLSTGERHCITDPAAAGEPVWVGGLALSPDGASVAFGGQGAKGCCDLFVIPRTGGKPRQLTFDKQLWNGDVFLGHYNDYMWTPDSKSIVFFSNVTGVPWLWRVPAQGGPIEREAVYPFLGSLSRDGKRLVYSEKTTVQLPEIWRADLAAPGGPVLGTRKVIGVQEEPDAQPTPDGSQLVWTSYRTGFYEVWTSGSNGETPRQLTRLERMSGTPRWSPDGKWVAFDSYNRGVSVSLIYVVDAQGGNLHAVTDASSLSFVPSWSRDGKSIYFDSLSEEDNSRPRHMAVWKQSLETGKRLQLTHQESFDPLESYDGRTVFFSKYAWPGIWSVPSGGGAESLVIADKPQSGYWGHWAVTTTGLYLLNAEAAPRPKIEFFNFATRRTSPVLTLDKQPLRWFPSLSATADGKTIYYTQWDRQSVIRMMEISH